MSKLSRILNVKDDCKYFETGIRCNKVRANKIKIKGNISG